MNDIAREYCDLFQLFLTRQVPVEEFQLAFLERFKRETRPLASPVYELLQEAFGDADSFSTDCELIAQQPDFYLDEAILRAKIARAAALLMNLSGSR